MGSGQRSRKGRGKKNGKVLVQYKEARRESKRKVRSEMRSGSGKLSGSGKGI
jgi:hypothetical protein